MGLQRLGQLTPEVPPSLTVLQAVHLMVEHGLGAIVITEERKLAGVFTERDLMIRVVAQKRDPGATLIGEVMTRKVVSVPDSTSVPEAAALMRANHCRHLPIVDDNGEVISVVALRYLLYDMMDDLDVKVGDLERYLMEDSRGG